MRHSVGRLAGVRRASCNSASVRSGRSRIRAASSVSLTSWPTVFFWPAIVMGLILSALGLVWRRSSLPNAGALLTLPAAVYLSATPRFQFVGFVPVACLLLAAYTVR